MPGEESRSQYLKNSSKAEMQVELEGIEAEVQIIIEATVGIPGYGNKTRSCSFETIQF